MYLLLLIKLSLATICFNYVTLINCQQLSSGRSYYDSSGIYVPPAPGDADHLTFIKDGRRYGQAPPPPPGSPYAVPGSNFQPAPYDPAYNPYTPFNPLQVQGGFPIHDPSKFDQAGVQLPGILGGWRSDIQGRQRPDSPRQETDRDVTVTTAYGEIQGFRVYLYDNPIPELGFRPGLTPVERVLGNVSVFLGIPYAQSPEKEGRFKPPRAHRGWQVLQAVDFGPACPQPTRYTGATKGIRDVHEDCLYLNVYTPTTASGLAKPYPVMVYIHGGNFFHGASNTFPGHTLAAFYNVVVVTINYRLGALGFLSTGDPNSPGNYGILDQSMALRWIYENIQSFNGDRYSITLFGPDAGAASAGLLMVNPRTRHMVNRVIAQSGSPLADWALILDHYRAENTSKVYAQQLGCSIESSYKIVDCLKKRSFHELGNAEFDPQVGTFAWGPVLDKGFQVPGDDWYEGWKQVDWYYTNNTVEEDLRKKRYNHGLSYMTGVTTQEAAYVISNNETLAPTYEIDENWFDNKIKELVLRYNYTLNPEGIYRAIKYRYTYWPDQYNKTHIREQFIQMLSDFLYVSSTDKIVKLLVEQKVPVFWYVMNTTIEALHFPEWRKYPHDIEWLLLSGAPFMDTDFFPSNLRLERNMWTDNDRNMSHFFMKSYSNFARYGNPTHSQILGLHYEVATHGSLKYLNLNTTYNSSVYLNYKQTESAFWTWYLPTVIGILLPTYPPSTEYWWEPREPLQIAFWSMSVTNLLLIVVVVIFCILWRNAKRQQDRYYSGDVLMLREEPERFLGIDNKTQSASNIYEYRDVPSKRSMNEPGLRSKAYSTPSLRSGSNSSLKDSISTAPNGRPRTPPNYGRRNYKRGGSTDSVPMTTV